MSASGVGVLVSLTYASALDDPGRFRRSRQVGAHFGLTPKRYQSGEMDVSGRISKIGDRKAGLLRVRTVLYEAAHIILTRPVKAGALKSWTQGRVGASGGSCRQEQGQGRACSQACRGIARTNRRCRLHRMLVDGTSFAADKAAMVKG